MTDEEIDAELAKHAISPQTVGDMLNLSFKDWENRQKVAELHPRDNYVVSVRYTATIPHALAQAYLKRLMTYEAQKLLRGEPLDKP